MRLMFRGIWLVVMLWGVRICEFIFFMKFSVLVLNLSE